MKTSHGAYTGAGPYIFVSYAHDDVASVEPELVRLTDAGFNVWYDEGIMPGSSWRQELADQIAKASLFLFFVTPRSVASPNCQKEVHFAIEQGIPLMVVYLSETQMSTGMQLALSDIQAIMKHQLAQDDYVRKLISGVSAHLSPVVGDTPVGIAPTESKSHAVPIMMAAGVVAVAIIAGALLIRPGTEDKALPEATITAEPEVPQAVSAPPEPGIVVLPFDNQSADVDNAFFTTGMHEDILSSLAKISGLRVISRTSALRYRDTDKPLAQIASELNVDHVLEGSVRRAGNRVRITVQLIEAATDRNRWSETFDRDLTDVFEIQSEVAQTVASQLEVTLDMATVARLKVEPVSPQAYDYYLKARAKLNENPMGWDTVTPGADGRIAIDLLEAALEIEEFGLAHAAIAEAHRFGRLQDWAQVREDAITAAERALVLAPESGEANFAMGYVLGHSMERRYGEAVSYIELARKYAPNSARYMWFHGYMLFQQGLINEAYVQMRGIINVDPLAPEAYLAQAEIDWTEGREGASRESLAQAIALAPNSVTVHRVAGFIYGLLGDQAASINMTRLAHEIDPDNWISASDMVYSLIEIQAWHSAEAWIDKLDGIDQFAADARRAWLYDAMDRRPEFIEVMKTLEPQTPDSPMTQWGVSLSQQFQAQAAHEQEDIESSVRLREAAIVRLADTLDRDRGEDGEITVRFNNVFIVLGQAYRLKSLGQDDRADHLIRRALTFLQEQDVFNQENGHFWQAQAYALLGDRQEMGRHLRLLKGSSFDDVHYFDVFLFRDNFGVFDGIRDDLVLQEVYQHFRDKSKRRLAQVHDAIPGFIDPRDL
jgi:TolB-like protein